MNGNSKVWVSELNEHGRFHVAAPIRFYDTTLRDGEQTVGVVLSPEQKLEIAHKLDALGIARIEAGFPRVSPEDAEAIRMILDAGLKAEIWGFSRAQKADIEALVELGVKATVIEVPTSDIKLKAYGLTREEAKARLSSAIKLARQHGIRVAFFPVDCTRTALDFLREIYLAALEAGAAELVVVDTIGVCGPEAADFLVAEVKRWVGNDVPIHWHGHNDFGFGTACSVAAVRAGATWIQGTINGMGERAGNCDIGETALALSCLYDVPVEMNLPKLRETSAIVQRLSGYSMEPWKPAVGNNLFNRESGAVATQFHIPEAIEPYAADLVGATRSIVLGKKSGLDSIDLKCRELKLEIATEQRAALLAAVKKKSIAKRGLVTDEEFRAIYSDVVSARAVGKK
ncbi:MAG: LeuA family protein [Terriglobales bacterium]